MADTSTSTASGCTSCLSASARGNSWATIAAGSFHNTRPADLIPVLSYLALRGRCRYCGKSISLQYPLVELATGLAFALLYLSHGQLDQALAAKLIFTSVLIVIAVYDFKHYLILDKVVFPFLAIAALYAVGRVRRPEPA